MSMIDSSWFLNKLKASANKPEQTLLAVFELLAEAQAHHGLPESTQFENSISARSELLAYLSQQAKKAKLQAPELFAQQLYYMANNAFNQQLANPKSNALLHAKQVTAALIKVQRQSGWIQNAQQYLSIKPFQVGLAASLLVLAGTASLSGYQHLHAKNGASLAQAESPLDTAQSSSTDASMASPSDTAEMYATIEKMRDGRCHYIEALQLPTAQQGVYLQNVIAGQVSSKAIDQKVARELMGKVSCDYTPMLMKNSAG